MTQAATIVPQYINQPKNPQWSHGSVKDVNGQLWSVHKNALQLFVQNQPAQVEWDQQPTWKYPKILNVNGTSTEDGAGVPVQGPQTPTQPQTAAQMYNKPLLQNAPQQAPDKEEGMFVMGVVGRAMGSGSFNPEQIPELTRIATHAWQTRHEPPVTVSTEPARSPGNAARNPPAETEDEFPPGYAG